MTRAGWAMVALIGLAAACSSTPSVPDEGTWPLVARTVLLGPMTPDATEGVDPDTLALSPAGDDCVQIDRPAGSWLLCWQAHRDPHDADPAQDYYRFHIGSSFGHEAGTGARWAGIRVRLVDEPSNGVFTNWPEGVFEGPCKPVDVSVGGVGPVEQETVCGRTTGSAGRAAWSYRVTWACVSCPLPNDADWSLPLHEWVAVPQGTVPTWEIYADLGS
jgi:hypothetical protein